MNIYSLLDESTITANLKVDSKEELINELVNQLRDKVSDETLENIRNCVFRREEMMSTGVGKGLAIPHGKCSLIDQNYACFALLEDGINFKSIDDEPVRIVFMLVGPESSSSQHIKLLSRISRLMNSSSFREKLLNCDTGEEIYTLFETEEAEYFAS